MMSTAILMTTGAEQTKASLVSADLSSDQGGLGGVSFAKSFQERAGVSLLAQEKNTADETAIALPGLKGTTLTKQPEEVAGRSCEVKGEPNTAEKIFVHSQLKDVAAGKIIQPQMTAVPGAQEKTSTGEAGTMNVDASVEVDETANDASLPSPIAYATPGSEAKAESLGPQASTADGDQPSVSSGNRPGVQKKTETTDKVIEGASSKKIAKAQESLATPKTVQKTGGKIVGVTRIEPKSVSGISTESAISLVGQPAALMAVLQGEISKAADPLSEAVSATTKPSTGISPTAVDGQVPKVVASGANAGVTDTAIMATAESDPIVSPKTDMSAEKLPAGAMPRGGDAENKPQAAQGSGTVLPHSIGIVPTAVVSGNTPVEFVATKLQPGEAGPHTAPSPTGLREQDGAVRVVQSMDGAPRMLSATPTSLEVGIQNGTHGWLRVRAEMTDGGVVNASVSATSSAGQEMLHRELPALTAYLQEEKVAVNAISVHASLAGGTDARSSSGTESTGSQTPQRSNEGEQQHQSLRKTTLNGSDETTTYGSLRGFDGDGSLPLTARASGGSWLSVRA
jgi:hypothetical protein